MARSYASDPVLSFNFALIDVPVVGVVPIVFPYKLVKSAISNGAFVGLQSITLPAMTNEIREVREGNWPYVHSILSGYTTGGDCVLTQAVMPIALDMYTWFQQGIWGRICPRRHFLVAHLRHDKRLPVRLLLLQECLPLSWQPSSELNASSSEVVVESLTLRVQRIEPIPVPSPDLEGL